MEITVKQSEKKLVIKMKDRMAKERERQQRWRVRQKEKGLKPIAGNISQKAFEIIQQEKERTGENISDILERAIFGLETIPGNDVAKDQANNVINNDTSDSGPDLEVVAEVHEAETEIDESKSGGEEPNNVINTDYGDVKIESEVDIAISDSKPEMDESEFKKGHDTRHVESSTEKDNNIDKGIDNVTNNDSTPHEAVAEDQGDIGQRILKMREKENIPFNEIARCFTTEGVPTLDGDESWEGKKVYQIYKDMKSANGS